MHPEYLFFHSQNEDSSEEEEEGSARIFRQLLFSLTREIVSEAYQHQHTPVPPPWIKQPFPPTKILLAVRTSSKPSLYAHAEEKVKVLFGWSPSSKKESLMMRWARKHRDLVDQVRPLVCWVWHFDFGVLSLLIYFFIYQFIIFLWWFFFFFFCRQGGFQGLAFWSSGPGNVLIISERVFILFCFVFCVEKVTF